MPQRRRDTLPKSHRRVAGQQVSTTGQPKRVSRKEREERQRKLLYVGVSIAASLVLVILAGAALNEYWFKPRHVLAEVDGTKIRRQDYWKYQAVQLADQASQYAQIANSGYVTQDQASQYSTLAQQTSAEIDKVWGSTSVVDATLQKMIDDQVYMHSLDEYGVTITDQDVEDYIALQYGPADSPIFTPTPSPTLIPERADWATETAVAAIATEIPTVAEAASPVAGVASPVTDGIVASPVVVSPIPAASPVASNETAATPIPAIASPTVASPESTKGPALASPISASPEASLVELASPVASPVGSPVATPIESPTPNQDQARQTATTNFKSYEDAVFDRAHISRDDYIRLIVKPAVATERINDQLTAGIGQSAEQVHAAHILVDTKDLADSIYQTVSQPGANFEEAAKENSVDSSTAPNGGDLGWFAKGQMVKPFEDAAFALQPGQISQPVQTEFGWHIIKVYDRQADRALTDDQISTIKQSTITNWLDGRKAEMKITSEIAPTATPSSLQNFVPPADAPPTPTATTEVIVASPAVDDGAVQASPEAVVSPAAGS